MTRPQTVHCDRCGTPTADLGGLYGGVYQYWCEPCGDQVGVLCVGAAPAVLHCGHATAIWPWFLETPAGRGIVAPNGRAFQYKKHAAAAAALLARGILIAHDDADETAARCKLAGQPGVLPAWQAIYDESGFDPQAELLRKYGQPAT